EAQNGDTLTENEDRAGHRADRCERRHRVKENAEYPPRLRVTRRSTRVDHERYNCILTPVWGTRITLLTEELVKNCFTFPLTEPRSRRLAGRSRQWVGAV